MHIDDNLQQYWKNHVQQMFKLHIQENNLLNAIRFSVEHKRFMRATLDFH